jgi:hypothetical protein
MTTDSQPRLLTYEELLTRAQADSATLETDVKSLKKELFDMSQHYLRMGWHRGFNDYYAQRREVSTQLLYTQRDLVRSQGREIILRHKIAAGEVRVPEIAAAVA